MLRVLLIDDEPSCLNQLERGLGGIVEITGKFANPLEALEHLDELQPNAVFLDIEMPGLDGFCVALEILRKQPDIGVVFVTAHSQFAVKAFEVDAVDYIMKPFGIERLGEAVLRLERKVALSAEEKTQIQEMINKKVIETRPQRIILWKENHAVLARASKVACCFVEKARRDVTVIAEGGAFKSSNNFKDFLELLGPRRLLRCHRCFAVNPEYLQELMPAKNHTMTAKVAGYPAEIPVSRQYSRIFREMIDPPRSIG